jgi:hypothetical protein
MSRRCFDSPTARRRRAAAGMFTTALILAESGSIAIAGTFSEIPNFGSNPCNLKMFTYVPETSPQSG